MKKFTILLVAVFLFLITVAQPPQGFKYQAVVRDAAGEIVTNQLVDFRLSIHNGSSGGPIVYRETQPVMTNAFGLANLVIGEGFPSIGLFENINWRDGQKFLEVETNLTGSFVTMGTAELYSVPYAMYAGSDWLRNGFNLYQLLHLS